jgi:hypothetical protein
MISGTLQTYNKNVRVGVSRHLEALVRGQKEHNGAHTIFEALSADLQGPPRMQTSPIRSDTPARLHVNQSFTGKSAYAR